MFGKKDSQELLHNVTTWIKPASPAGITTSVTSQILQNLTELPLEQKHQS